MEILCVRGENIASLAEPFEIDFTAEPLASAGLFAITGETGAGKSTILDAVCLALYGECPRLSGEGLNENVPDAGGENIKARDARGVLRSGAASGWAEVDFRGCDGIAYRARWSVHRARGRTGGRLQNVDRAVSRLDDGVVLDSQITAVKARVVEVSGLSYEEFCRTVLLAQGDFDAFLQAGTEDRASLLEKVTGTALYRNISKRVYERHETAQTDLAALRARRDGMDMLGDDERDGLLRKKAYHEARRTSLTRTISEMEAKIGVHDAVAAARSRLAASRSEAEAAEADARAVSGEREKLARIEAALLLSADRDALGARVDALATCRRDEVAGRGAVTDLEAKAACADAEHARAAEALSRAEAARSRAAPDWAEADRLDHEVRTAGEAVARVRKVLHDRKRDEEAAISGRDAALAQKDRGISDLEAVTREIGRAPGAHRLADAWETISRRLTARKTAVEAREGARSTLAAATAQRDGDRTRLETFKALDEADRDRVKDFDVAISVDLERYKEISDRDPDTALMRAERIRKAATAACDVAGQVASGAREVRDLEADITSGLSEIEAGETRIAEAKAETARAAAAISALEMPVRRAEAAASEMATALRAHLEAEAPCPVCGSCTHPAHDDPALRRIATEMRASLDDERAAADAARSEEVEAARAKATAQDRVNANRKRLSDLENRIAAHRAELARLDAELDDLGAGGAPRDHAAIAAAAAAEEESCLEIRREAGDLSKKIDKARTSRDALVAKIDDRSARRESLSARIAEKVSRIAVAERDIAAAGSEISGIDEEISPALATVNTTPARIEKDPDGMFHRLEGAVSWWKGLAEKRDAAKAGVSEAEPRIAAAEREVSAARSAREKTEAEMHAAVAKEGDLAARRGALLGGAPVAAHRDRIEGDVRKAAGQREEARDAVSRISAELATSRERVVNLASRREEAEAAAARAAETLDAGLDRAGMGRAELDRHLSGGRAAASRISAELEKIETRRAAARAAVVSREMDFEDLASEGVPGEDVDELRAARTRAVTERDDVQLELGGISTRIARDDGIRAGAAGLDAEITAARDAEEVWRATNAAIGSRRGGKFARVAQNVTLGMLVERANLHLRDLRPRYVLVRGGDDLSLHVADMDMGGEVRSTRLLSGGERFLVSLSLALALSRMSGRGGMAGMLFIDEGFGALNAESLEMAMDALDLLQAQGRTIGVISHVDAMRERIPVQVRVRRVGAGRSDVEVS